MNEPRIFKGIFAIIKPFLKEKIANRVSDDPINLKILSFFLCFLFCDISKFIATTINLAYSFFFLFKDLRIIFCFTGSSLLCMVFSLQWLVLLQSTGSTHMGSVAVAPGLWSAGSVVGAHLVAPRHV